MGETGDDVFAVLAGLVTAVPQLVWLSEHKALVFGVAAGLLLVSGWLYGVATIAYLVGVTFAFVLPAVM